jgi:hypothetical protein
MTELFRRDYRRPRIISGVAQILLDWTAREVEDFGLAIQNEAIQKFVGFQRQAQQFVQMSIGLKILGFSRPYRSEVENRQRAPFPPSTSI